jgi:clan AA aspartic protease (TIGR02281 family)
LADSYWRSIRRFWGAALVAALLGNPQTAQAQSDDPAQVIAKWNANNVTCRNANASALEAMAACEQRDTLAKVLALMNQCHGPTDKPGVAGWSACDAAKMAQSAALARTTVQFHRRGGVFVLPVMLNGTATSYFVVDSGATNIQIPQEVADELAAKGVLNQSDYLRDSSFVVADGRRLTQKVVRLRAVQVGNRTMENVLAAVGAPRSQALLGQSLLRRLNWWKIDNVKNAIELEFTGSF